MGRKCAQLAGVAEWLEHVSSGSLRRSETESGAGVNPDCPILEGGRLPAGGYFLRGVSTGDRALQSGTYAQNGERAVWKVSADQAQPAGQAVCAQCHNWRLEAGAL